MAKYLRKHRYRQRANSNLLTNSARLARGPRSGLRSEIVGSDAFRPAWSNVRKGHARATLGPGRLARGGVAIPCRGSLPGEGPPGTSRPCPCVLLVRRALAGAGRGPGGGSGVRRERRPALAEALRTRIAQGPHKGPGGWDKGSPPQAANPDRGWRRHLESVAQGFARASRGPCARFGQDWAPRVTAHR